MLRGAGAAALLAAAIVLAFPGVSPAAGASQKDEEIAPDFTLDDAAGTSVSFGNFRDGRGAILFFWTTWCPFCRKELAALNSECKKFEEEGVAFLAVNVGESPAKVERYLKGNGISCRVLLDKEMSVTEAYGVLGVPTYVLIDTKGRVHSRAHSFPGDQYKTLVNE